jgi:hypothetical protein
VTGAGSAKFKALEAWTELNDRQQGTLAVIYELDQENEMGRRADAARGHYDKTPAAEWRLLDFAHDPSLRELLGPTAMQAHLESRGWDNQGNGSTMAALVKRGLVVHGERRPTRFGRMMRVKLTNQAGRPPGQACPGSRAGSRRTCCPPAPGRCSGSCGPLTSGARRGLDQNIYSAAITP